MFYGLGLFVKRISLHGTAVTDISVGLQFFYTDVKVMLPN